MRRGGEPETDVNQPNPPERASAAPTRSEMEERLLDYLYGELEPEHRAAFERALPAHPEIAAELERHRWTRARMSELPVVPLPAGALDQALLAAERHIASVAPAPERPGFFARLAKLLMQPAFATALVAMLAVGVGLFMSKSRELPGEGPRADDQLGLAPPRANETSVPAVRVAEHTKADAPVVENEAVAAAAPSAPAAVVPAPAAEPSKATGPTEAADPAATLAEGDANLRAAKGGEAVVTELAKPARARANPSGVGGPAPADEYVLRSADSAVAKDIAAEAKKEEESAPAQIGGGRAATPAEAPAVWGDTSADAPNANDRRTTNTEHQAAATTARDGAAGLTDKLVEDAERSAPRPTSDREVEVTQALGRESRTVTIDDDAKPAPPAPKLAAEKAPTTTPAREEAPRAKAPEPAPAPDSKVTKPSDTTDKTTTQAPPTEARLWTTYQQQLAAGAYTDAEKTLADLKKLTGETAKLKAARADLGKRTEESRRADKPAVDPKLPDPNAPQPGKAP